MEERIAACVEAICNKGCRAVRADIAALERGGSVAEAAGLDQASVAKLLDELRSVMAAYGDVCR